MSVKVFYHNWKAAIWGLIIGIIVGIKPFFVDIFCNFNEVCEFIFLWPVYLLFPFLKMREITGGDEALVVFFIAPMVYPLLGLLIGLIVRKIRMK
jgi:hypothetical protein